MNESTELECSRCHTIQPISEFYKTTNYWHEKRGRTYVCKTCSRKSARDSAQKKRKEVKDGTDGTTNKEESRTDNKRER